MTVPLTFQAELPVPVPLSFEERPRAVRWLITSSHPCQEPLISDSCHAPSIVSLVKNHFGGNKQPCRDLVYCDQCRKRSYDVITWVVSFKGRASSAQVIEKGCLNSDHFQSSLRSIDEFFQTALKCDKIVIAIFSPQIFSSVERIDLVAEMRSVSLPADFFCDTAIQIWNNCDAESVTRFNKLLDLVFCCNKPALSAGFFSKMSSTLSSLNMNLPYAQEKNKQFLNLIQKFKIQLNEAESSFLLRLDNMKLQIKKDLEVVIVKNLIGSNRLIDYLSTLLNAESFDEDLVFRIITCLNELRISQFITDKYMKVVLDQVIHSTIPIEKKYRLIKILMDAVANEPFYQEVLNSFTSSYKIILQRRKENFTNWITAHQLVSPGDFSSSCILDMT